MNRVYAKGGFFIEKSGDIVLFRGVNLSGSSKVPMLPDGTTSLDQTESFKNHENVSFIGRPFPEEEASIHFDRIKKWGFNFLRFIVTWEAIEHAGPGKYDDAYCEYVKRMVTLADKKGLYVYIDPHQDVWSRFTGGDGAPGWTLETIGIDIMKLKDSGLAILQHEEKENYRKMSWPLNNQKYAAATMFTLFFSGNTFAPGLKIDNQGIQNYLQNHYINAVCHLARKLAKLRNVVGIGSMNEPSGGFIGKKNLKKFEGLAAGLSPISTPFQEMCSSEGVSVKIPLKFMIGQTGIPISSQTLNPKKISIWKKGYGCVWRKQGVWNFDPNGAPMLLKPDYFKQFSGKEVDFFQDFLKPFVKHFKTSIQKVNKSFFIFMESDPVHPNMDWYQLEKGTAGVVNAAHWYDTVTLFTKKNLPFLGIHSFTQKLVFGRRKVEDMYFESISAIKSMSTEEMGKCPTLIGETGIPFDLDHGAAYKTGDYSKQEELLDRIFRALERNFVNVALWNYTSDNTHALGDHWNGEDLSIYSADTPLEYDSDGGRATIAFSRPYPVLTGGIPLALSFDYKRGLFKYSFRKGTREKGRCVIFIPEIHYRNGFKVLVNAGKYSFKKEKNLLYFEGEKGVDLYGITIVRE